MTIATRLLRDYLQIQTLGKDQPGVFEAAPRSGHRADTRVDTAGRVRYSDGWRVTPACRSGPKRNLQ